jgi:hypothetical protein
MGFAECPKVFTGLLLTIQRGFLALGVAAG